jgi:hypothetical protein
VRSRRVVADKPFVDTRRGVTKGVVVTSGLVRRIRANASASVRQWRRRRATAAFVALALAGTGGVVGFMHASGARGPVVDGYEQVTLADTAYAIPPGAVFVSPTGQDTNPGTQYAPFATIAKALTVAPSGGTIVLRGGTYREKLSITRRVTIQAYPHEAPWLDGADPATAWLAFGPYSVLLWHDPLCDSCVPPSAIDPAYPTAGLPEQMFIDGTPLRQVTSIAALDQPGTFYVDLPYHCIVTLDQTVGHSVAVTDRDIALQVSGYAAGTIVRGVGILHYGATWSGVGSMVSSSAPGVTFDHDTFAWSASRGLTVYGPNSVVANNLFLYNGSNGFHAYRADGLIFQNNRVAYSNEEHFSIAPSPTASEAGAKITHTWNGVVSGNVFDDNAANGLWFDVASTNIVIANNTLIQNAGHGLAYEISGRALIAGNLIARNGRDGIKLSGVSGAEVWNNTVVGNGWSQVGVYEDPRHDSNPADNAAGIIFDTSNVHLANNALVADPTSAHPVLESFDISSPRHLTTGQMISFDDRNVWSRPVVSAPQQLVTWESTLMTFAHYTSLAGVQAGTGREVTSSAADNTPWSTLFLNPSANDFRAAAGGPLAQPGLPVPAAVAAAMGTATTGLGIGAPSPPLWW